MTDQIDANIAKSGQFSVFVQPDGSSPANAWLYVGCLSLGGFTEDLGTGEPIYCPSSESPGQFDIVDTTSPPSSLPTTDFTQHMSRLLNDFWWGLRKRRCEFNLAVKGSNCARPDDPSDFQSKIIARKVKVTNFTTGAFHTLGEDAVIDLTGSLIMRGFDRFLPIQIGEVADTTTFSEVLNGIYADKSQCGDCGDVSDGCKKMYALTTTITASPALASQIVHSIDGGQTWTTDNINSLSTQAAKDLARVGTRIVVVSQVDNAHHYKLQSSIDANVSSGWTRVPGGYVATKGPNAIWSRNPSESFIAAQGGYIYFMSNPTSSVTVLTDGSVSVQNLNDIRGAGQTIVAVGASNAVLASYNNGRTWTLVTGPAVGIALNTIEVINKSIWFVGAANGKSFYTTNSGTTWVEFTPDALITVVNKIRFVDEIVGYMVVTLSGSTRLYRTDDTGNTWRSEAPYVNGLPQTASKYNFVTPCPNNYNTVLVGGLKTAAPDGIIAIGVG